MTAVPPPPLEPGAELVVTRRLALMRGLGWPLLALGAVIAVLAALLVIVLVKGAGRDDLIGELACQVQQLGGEPVAGVSCPPTPPPAVRRTTAPKPSSAVSPAPAPTIVVVLPDGTRTVVASPAPRSTSSPRPPPKASSSPRATPSPSPLVQICPPRLPCLPPHVVPRRRSS